MVARIQKLFSDFWNINIGHVVTVVVFICGLVYGYARLEARVEIVQKETKSHADDTAIHIPLEKKMQIFVTKAEYEAKVKSRDTEFNDIKMMIRDTNSKVDALYQLQIRNSK